MIKKLVPLALALVAAAAAVAACGDDDDDDELSHAEYFAQVDQLESDVNDAFENDIFGAENAKAGLENFVAAAQDFHDGLDDLTPPADAEDAHNDLLSAVDDTVGDLEELADETDEDTPTEELESIIFGGDEDPFADITDAECRLVEIAQENDIETEFLTCDEAEGAEAAGDNPVGVEAVEFEFNLDGEFSADSTGFTLTNAGEQPHEAFIARIPEDADLDELLASEEEPEGVEDVGGTFAEPGNEAGFGFEEPLEPGRYVLVCFVPDEETGEPHAALGMVSEFTVE